MKKDQTFIQSLKGWLSGNAGLKEERALHQLAQDDPFLADSWEGYQSTGAEDHEHKLQQIRQRLAHKAEKRKGFPIWLRVAAGGAILIAALFTLRWVNDTSADQIGQSTPELTEQSPIEAPSPGDLEEAIVTTEETPEATSKDEAMPSPPEVSIAKEKAAEAHPRSKKGLPAANKLWLKKRKSRAKRQQ